MTTCRPDLSKQFHALPYGYIRVLRQGSVNPFATIATEVGPADHIDLVLRSPGWRISHDEADDARAHRSSPDAPVLAYVPNANAMDLAVGADLVLTEEVAVAVEARRRFGVDRVLLLDPSIDTGKYNPAGFERVPPFDACVFVERSARNADVVKDLVAARGVLEVIVEPGTVLPEGIRSTELEQERWADRCRNYGISLADRHLHGSEVSFAEHVLAVTAAGTPVATEPEGSVQRLLPGLTVDIGDDRRLRSIADDPLARERLSVAARRHVLRNHGRRQRFEAVLDVLEIPRQPPPLVSVLLSTRRPGRLAAALASIGHQRYPRVEVVVVLHGEGFDRAEVDRLASALSAPVTVIEAPAYWRLGDCLNAAVDRASGHLVTKMDDDDAYGPEHIEDLVTAYEFSGADIVGRPPDFVYLAERDETLMITTGLAERYGHHVAGPTMLMASALARTLRFERRRTAVDQSLYDRAVASGHQMYATSPFDFVLYRGHGDHTWDARDSDFLDASIRRWNGTVAEITNVNSDGAN